MEDVLDLYAEDYDADFPVVCVDESPKQLMADTHPVINAKPGQPIRYDYEYKRYGTANLFMISQPLVGWRHVEITESRTAIDYAHFMKLVADVYFPDATIIRVVQDNLNTHSPASFYNAFSPEEARRLTQRFDFRYTPKHGSWLNIAEIEFSVLSRQCLAKRRLNTLEILRHEVATWESDRNVCASPIEWRFSTTDARIKLQRLYPA